MEKIILEEKNVVEYIDDTINEAKFKGSYIENAGFHHNTEYKDAVSICKHGILTLSDLNKYGIRKDNEDFIKLMSDINSHVNGNDCVSLSVVGLTDIYPNEDLYNPFRPSFVDFVITNNIKVSRSSINYGNEYLIHRSIKREELRAIDIRLLKFINSNIIGDKTLNLIEKYNYLIDIAIELEKKELDIPLREMSKSSIFQIDTKKICNKPKLILKNR